MLATSGLWWEAYCTLNAARQFGMNGPQPISVADIMAYCAIVGMTDPQDRLELLRAVQAMDTEHAKWDAERRKNQQRSAGDPAH